MIKSFFKDSALYTLAGIFTKGIGFLLLPIYTRFLSKEDYGAFDFITAIGSIIAVIVALEITQGVIRFVSEENCNKTRGDFISTSLLFTNLSYLFFFIIVCVFSDYISLMFFDNETKGFIIILSFVLYWVNANVYLLIVSLRSQLKSKLATSASAVSAFFICVFSVLLIVAFDFGLKGIILGNIAGGFATLLFLFYFNKNVIRFAFDLLLLRRLLTFSYPLVFSSLGVVLSMFVDRIFVKEHLGLESLAEYGVAIRVASFVSLLVFGFQSALAPLIYNNLDKKDTKYNISILFNVYIFISFSLFFLILVFSEYLIHFLAGDGYSSASSLTYILAASVLIHNMYIFFPGLTVAKKTKLLAAINILSGLVNVTLNFILLPVFGIIGAAYSTLLSALFYFSMNALLGNRYYPVPFFIRKADVARFISLAKTKIQLL